ncbi:hypothetical protein QBC46DRAFT_363211 [Diplogelasinospora grovesii]|uniref:Tyrosinase copper-binding domain-containing protein n=1 Tax=Diplogelasinospora grovesii TaxID=303347 RepID=A0AAN6NA69_9PEZI|nr:hypothetical protein QBC46DRAFT_363211 [Diplogelasinospora grovesii]
MMVDFWNPIYSWRRLVLMKYVPRDTELNEKDQRYDLEARFIANVEKSSNVQSKTVDSPEYQFLQLLKRSLTQHQDDVTAYIEAINKRMTEEPEQALQDYLALAESRRRIYRPLPLDEFGFTLPFARNTKLDTPLREMTKEGRIQNVPKLGVDSLMEWATKLASVDPAILPPANSIPSWGAPLPIYDLPRPALLSIPCQSLSNLEETSGASGAVAVTNGCPYMSRRRPAQESGGSESLDSAVTYSLQATNVVRTPNWTDDILPLINAPYWKGARWIEAMYDYGKWYLNSYNDVKGKALSSIPITRDPRDYWPEEALELFRTWANAASPKMPAPTYLTELALYQSKLDDILQWQELGLIHADWCLHYQEATFLWQSPPKRILTMPAFRPCYSRRTPDQTPLKYALAFNGKSKGGEPPEKNAFKHVKLFKGYHAQITAALKQGTFTSGGTAQGFGFPWANIQTFSYKQDDKLYPYRHDFDGLFEQVHDDFHGWVGPDMAKKLNLTMSYYHNRPTIFLSYHANMDRLAGMFMEAHADNQFTSNFPLQPFVNQGTDIDISYDDPRRWSYTTIGDMAKDTRALGYMYGLPADRDVFVLEPSAVLSMKPKASGGRAITLPPPVTVAAENVNAKRVSLPIVVFEDVGCTDNTYRIDVFTPDAENTDDASVGNPDFIGQVTRLGMGPGTGTGRGPNGGRSRCRKPEATRILSAGHVADKLKPKSTKVSDDDDDAETPAVKIVVTDLHDGRRLGETEYMKMPGFEPKVIWLAG